MHSRRFRRHVGALLVCCWVTQLCGGGIPRASAQQGGFTADQLDQLMGPIALYPDPLLAQILPAATFVSQIQAAAQFLTQHPDPSQIDQQDWDMSVKAIAHYPEIIKKLNGDLDWTTQIGQAFVGQQKELLQSIQRLRGEAKAAGALKTSQQQQVIVEGSTIKIVPAQPTVIYVPTYDPQVVYVKQEDKSGDAAAAALIAFGVGVAIGSWLSRDCNWNSYTVFYHGWVGPGWVTTCRPRYISPVYVRSGYAGHVTVNTAVVNRTVAHDVRYNTWSGRTVTSGSTYNAATGRATRGTATTNPYTGRTTAAGSSYNARTGRASTGAATYNPYTGRTSEVSHSANAYTGRETTHRSTSGPGGATATGSSYNAYTGRETVGGAHTNPWTGNTTGAVATKNPRTGETHVYTGRNRR